MQNLTQTAQLTPTVTPAVTVSSYKFEIKRTSSSTWYTLGTGPSNFFSWERRVAGQFHLRVAATIEGRVFESENIYGATRFPNYSAIVGDSTVSTQTSNAWTNTLNATTATTRREEGFWIRLNTTGTGTYEFTATIPGPNVGPTTGASINLGARPADSSSSPDPNASGVTYTVASFHTHTPTTYRADPRDVGPSGPDAAQDAADNVTGVVYDYTESPAGSGSIPAGHPLNSAAQRSRSGPERRSTP